nr:cardiolipin synthase B [Actinomycetota bacterium]
KRSLDLTSAYFVPRPAFIQALVEAAQRGVEVRVLVPGPHVDKEIVRIAGRSTYEQLMRGGVQIFEYQPTMLHAKSLVVDKVWTTIGSVHFDNRSFQLNDEATLCIQGSAFAQQLTEVFEDDLVKSEKMKPRRWLQRGPVQRSKEMAARLLRREL